MVCNYSRRDQCQGLLLTAISHPTTERRKSMSRVRIWSVSVGLFVSTKETNVTANFLDSWRWQFPTARVNEWGLFPSKKMMLAHIWKGTTTPPCSFTYKNGWHLVFQSCLFYGRIIFLFKRLRGLLQSWTFYSIFVNFKYPSQISRQKLETENESAVLDTKRDVVMHIVLAFSAVLFDNGFRKDEVIKLHCCLYSQ